MSGEVSYYIGWGARRHLIRSSEGKILTSYCGLTGQDRVEVHKATVAANCKTCLRAALPVVPEQEEER